MSKTHGNVWDRFPDMGHLRGVMREKMEVRRRLRAVRYMLFRLQTSIEKGESLEQPLPGFIEFWLQQKPQYAVDPRGERRPVPPNKDKMVLELGGYKDFAKVWDVDEELEVYIRHSTIWQEWNATLHRIVPVIGE